MKEAIELAALLQEAFKMNSPYEIALAVSIPIFVYRLPDLFSAIAGLMK